MYYTWKKQELMSTKTRKRSQLVSQILLSNCNDRPMEADDKITRSLSLWSSFDKLLGNSYSGKQQAKASL